MDICPEHQKPLLDMAVSEDERNIHGPGPNSSVDPSSFSTVFGIFGLFARINPRLQHMNLDITN